jgi:hypothetical protein
MNEYARCHGVFPQGQICSLRRSCLRYQADQGTLWISPNVENDRCFDYLTPFGWAMIKNLDGGHNDQCSTGQDI